MLTRGALVKGSVLGLLGLGMGRGHPVAGNRVESFQIQPVTTGSTTQRNDLAFSAQSCAVLNQSGNTILVTFRSLGDDSLASLYDMVVPPFTYAVVSTGGCSAVTIQVLYTGLTIPQAAFAPAPQSWRIVVTMHESIVAPGYYPLPRGTAFRDAVQSVMPGAHVYTVWRWSIGTLGQNVWMSSQINPLSFPYNQITGLDMWINASSPGTVDFALSSARGGFQSVGSITSGSLTPPTSITLPAGSYYSMDIALDDTADLVIAPSSGTGTWSGQAVLRGY